MLAIDDSQPGKWYPCVENQIPVVANSHKWHSSLPWRHNGSDGVSNNQSDDCLLNRSCRFRSKKTLKLLVTGFCEWTSLVIDEFPTQMASNAENVSTWWRHHVDSTIAGVCVWWLQRLDYGRLCWIYCDSHKFKTRGSARYRGTSSVC